MYDHVEQEITADIFADDLTSIVESETSVGFDKSRMLYNQFHNAAKSFAELMDKKYQPPTDIIELDEDQIHDAVNMASSHISVDLEEFLTNIVRAPGENREVDIDDVLLEMTNIIKGHITDAIRNA